ncbi:MAG TPA: Hint domain-containing protein [Anaerolineales bacterium]
MTRLALALTIGLALILAACAPFTSGPPTPILSTVSIETVETVEPVIITPLPPDYTPPPAPTPTPIPTLPGGLGPTDLKYRILDQFPDFFFCDPDYYPVPREDELELARQRFPEIQSDSEEFDAILAHNNLVGVSTFTDDQKLLVYREHKKLAAIQLELAGDAYQFQIQVAKTEGEGELVTGLVDGQGSITVLQRTASIATCPICLAAGTLIDTPAGPLPVQSLRLGMQVWTLDAAGGRIARPLVQIGKTIVPAGHQVLHLVLDNGRELWVSPGHPTAEGLTVGQLQAGDPLSGGIILSAERVRYTGSATYDLLPAGETGFYWANGILLSSTLKPLER